MREELRAERALRAELLEALKLAFKLPRPWLLPRDRPTFAEWDAAMDAIEKAIAKAEGRD